MGEERSQGHRGRGGDSALSGRKSRNKGSAFERLIANALKPYWPTARRGIGQARSAGEVADVEGTPYWFELKRQKKCSIPAAIRQAEAATDGRPVVVVTKDDWEPIQVTHRFAGYWVTESWDEFLARLSLASSETSA